MRRVVKHLVPIIGTAAGLSVGLFAAFPGISHPASPPAPNFLLSHTPPVLLQNGEPISFTFGVACARTEATPCRLSGILNYRLGATGPFQSVSLAPTADDTGVDWTVSLPSSELRVGRIDYYATFTETATGVHASVPDGGVAAPQTAWLVRQSQDVTLAKHDFGSPTTGTTRAHLTYGTATGQVGLKSGIGELSIGPAAFDVSQTGELTVLDQVNGRLEGLDSSQRWRSIATVPESSGDVVLGKNSTAYVLDMRESPAGTHGVTAYDQSGVMVATAEIREHTVAKLYAHDDEVDALTYPSSEWVVPIKERKSQSANSLANAGVLAPVAQGAPYTVVSVRQNETRVAVIRAGFVSEAWILRSATPLADIQIADMVSGHVVVLQRVWDPTHAEYVAIDLSSAGGRVVATLPASDFGAPGAFGRFRLAGSQVFEMQADESGVSIDSYPLSLGE